MEFCECGSIIISGNCSNRKCKHHIKELVEPATFKQIEYIKELAERLGEGTDHIDFEYLSKKEAKFIIDEYLERVEAEEE